MNLDGLHNVSAYVTQGPPTNNLFRRWSNSCYRSTLADSSLPLPTGVSR